MVKKKPSSPKRQQSREIEELKNRYGSGIRKFHLLKIPGADLQNEYLPRIDCSHGDLRDVILKRANIKESILCNADLRGSDLRDTDLSWCDLSEANLSDADMRGAYLHAANLSSAYLNGANLFAAQLEGANLGEVDISESDLRGANLSDADLSGAYVGNSNLSKANLSNADLNGADLSRCDLRSTQLCNADLSDADLSKSDLSWANLRWAILHNTNINETNLTGAQFDDDADLLGAKWFTIQIGAATYNRAQVENGEVALPYGLGSKLKVSVETARLSGQKLCAASAIADYLASGGIDAEVVNIGGGGTVLRFSLRSKEPLEPLLHAGDAICRLTGLQDYMAELMRKSNTITHQTFHEYVSSMSGHLDVARGEAGLRAEDFENALDCLSREDLIAVKLNGFQPTQMNAIRMASARGNEILKVATNQKTQSTTLTVEQRVSKKVYDSKVGRLLQSMLDGLFLPWIDKHNQTE